jgi:methionyl aminopeptidase
MITIKTQEEIALMRISGKIAAEILQKTAAQVKPGMTTREIDELAEELIFAYAKELAEKESGLPQEILSAAFRGQPSGRNGELYPAVLCASVNSTVVHGLPSDYVLKSGDILSLDFGVKYRGYYSDTAITVAIGEIDHEDRRLIHVTKKALRLGLKKVRAGNTTGDIGNTIQRFVEGEGFSVVRDLVGHGIGTQLHEEPHVPNYGKRRSGVKLEKGMVIAIEPMVTRGDHHVAIQPDGQGYQTKDKSQAAHFEHTVVVTENGHEVLTIL